MMDSESTTARRTVSERILRKVGEKPCCSRDGSFEGSGMIRPIGWAWTWMRTFTGGGMILALVEADERKEAALVADDAQAAAAEANARTQAEREPALR
jgi:hypothetical protein